MRKLSLIDVAPPKQAQKMSSNLNLNGVRIDLEYLRRQRIIISIPCYGGMLTEPTFNGVLEWSAFCRHHNIDFCVDTIYNESLITRGRNTLVARFMNVPTATHLMFIDADIGFEPWHLLSLVSHDVDLCAGMYPAKTLPIKYVVNGVTEQPATATQLQEGVTVGTGFMLIKRKVFDSLYSHPEVKRYSGDMGFDTTLDNYMASFFDCLVVDDPKVGPRYYSEDWLFCKRWREMGGKVWVDTRVRLIHFGTYPFGRDRSTFFNPEMPGERENDV